MWAESKYGNKIAEALTPFLPQAAVALKVTEGMTLLVGTVSEFLANNITKYDDGNGLSIKIYPQELRIEIVSN